MVKFIFNKDHLTLFWLYECIMRVILCHVALRHKNLISQHRFFFIDLESKLKMKTLQRKMIGEQSHKRKK
jgi:hypothetical protein